MKGEGRFHLSAAVTDFPDHGGLEDHHLTVELAEDLDTVRVAFVVAIASHSGLDYITLVHRRCRHGLEHFVVVLVVFNNCSGNTRQFVFAETGEEWNRPRVLIQFQHR